MKFDELLQRPALELLDRMGMPTALVDADGRLVHANPALVNFGGVPLREMIGKPVVDRVLDEERRSLYEHADRLRREGSSMLRVSVETPEKARRTLLLVSVALWSAQGDYVGEVTAVLPADAAEMELSARIVQAGSLARSVVRDVAAELPAHSGAGRLELSGLAESVPELARLTRQEWAVASRLASGQRTQAIARELRISPSTVRNHLKAIFRKTGTSTQAGLVARMRRWSDARNG